MTEGTPAGHGELRPTRVGWFELFYDLVVVAAIIQGSNVFAEEPSFANGFWLAITLVIMFVLWILTVLTFNVWRAEWPLGRLLVLVQMLALIVSCLAISRDGGLSDAVGFLFLSVAFLSVTILHLLIARSDPALARPARMVAWSTGIAATVFAGGSLLAQTSGASHSIGSGIALAIGLACVVIPVLVGVLPTLVRTGALQFEHLEERLGQLVIIVLGESFVKLVLSLGSLNALPDPIFFVLTFVVVYCIWTLYFRNVLPAGMPRTLPRLQGWVATHWLLMFGVTGTASALAALTVLPLGEREAPIGGVRTVLPLAYVMLAFLMLTALAASRQRSVLIVHAIATGVLVALVIVGLVSGRSGAIALASAGAAVVILDAVVLALRRR